MRLRYFVAGFLVALIVSATTAWAASQLAIDPVTRRVIEGVGSRGGTPRGKHTSRDDWLAG